MMVALAAIDFLACYYRGKRAGPNGYQEFVKKYLQPLAAGKLRGYDPEVLYRNLRSGLIHNYSTMYVEHFQPSRDLVYVLTDDPGKAAAHLIQLDKTKVLFNVQTFFNDIDRAKDQYFQDLASNNELQRRFQMWYPKGGYLTDIDLSKLVSPRGLG